MKKPQLGLYIIYRDTDRVTIGITEERLARAFRSFEEFNHLFDILDIMRGEQRLKLILLKNTKISIDN